MGKFNIVKIVIILLIGIFLGVVWHWLYIFPFPQLHTWKHAEGSKSSLPEVDRPGRWHSIKHTKGAGELSAEQKEMIKKLESIGYTAGSQTPPVSQNITMYDQENAFNGYNFLISAHAPEAVLMNMQGEVLHTWRCDLARAWPDYKPEEPSPSHYFWRRAQLLENGDIIVIFSGSGTLKLDKDSNVIWSVFNQAHHDFYIAENNNIYVLTRKAHINKKYNTKKPILEDYICILDQNGKQLKKISILEALEQSKFSPILNRLESWGDITHTNTIQVIERNTSIPEFTKGRILVSLLSLDLICLIDIHEGVVWAESDLWSRQHESILLENDNMIVLDNKGIEGKSRIIEFDPITREFYWVYGGKDEEPFNTPSCGACQRLPNGNTLITETDAGRAFEVTSDKNIVWEYINPHRAGENDEYIASLHEVTRIYPDFPLPWLELD